MFREARPESSVDDGWRFVAKCKVCAQSEGHAQHLSRASQKIDSCRVRKQRMPSLEYHYSQVPRAIPASPCPSHSRFARRRPLGSAEKIHFLTNKQNPPRSHLHREYQIRCPWDKYLRRTCEEVEEICQLRPR